MHDLRVYLKINKKTILTCLHDENTHANCLPTSLLDYSVKQEVLVICFVLGYMYTTLKVVRTHEGLPMTNMVYLLLLFINLAVIFRFCLLTTIPFNPNIMINIA